MLLFIPRVCLLLLLVMCSSCDSSKQTPQESSDNKTTNMPIELKKEVQAPEYFQAMFNTSKGTFIIESYRRWSPNGVDRLYNLLINDYFNGNAFFRVVPNFIAQFGIHPNPQINAIWDKKEIVDDPSLYPNIRGTLSYGTRGENSRTTHLIINFKDNSKHLDPTNPVVARVIKGMSTVDSLYNGYGDLPQFGGKSPEPQRMNKEGHQFLEKEYPELDYITHTDLI